MREVGAALTGESIPKSLRELDLKQDIEQA